MSNRPRGADGCGDLSRRGFLGWSAMAAAGIAGVSAADRLLQTEPSTDRRIRIGVSGGGFGACFPWHQHPDAVVTGVSDLLPDRRNRLMEVFRCRTAYASLEKLILARDIDAVAVFTPVPDHARHGQMVLSAGKHVICAAPAAMTIEQCQRLLDAVRRTGLTYMMAEPSFYRPETVAARQWYKQGRFGEIVYCEADYHHDHAEPNATDGHHQQGPMWRYGLPPMHYATHVTALLTGVTGERIVEVSCMGRGDGSSGLRDNPYKNLFAKETALCRTDQGHYCRMSVWRKAHAGFAERAQWFGTKMGFCLPNSNGIGAVPTTTARSAQPCDRPIPGQANTCPEPLPHDSGHDRAPSLIVHEFVQALVSNRRPATDIHEALAQTVPGIIAHQSALRGGELMKVPQFDPKT